MNKIYKVIWSKTTQAWVATSELTRGQGKSSSSNTTNIETLKVVSAVALAGLGVLSVNPAMALGTNAYQCDSVSSTASGAESLACGLNAEASGKGSVALGNEAIATGGSNNTEGNYGASTAVGSGASATEPNATALGANSVSSGNGAVAVGLNSQAVTERTVAVGQGAIAGSATNSTHSATAIGYVAQALGGSSVALGNTAIALGETAIAIGLSSNATGGQAIAIGRKAIAIGRSAHAYGNNSIALGSGAIAGVTGSSDTIVADLAFGLGAQATGGSSIAQGNGAIASGVNAIAIGNGAQATAENSISIGTGNIVSGEGSGAIGDPNTITGDGSYAYGNDNEITANNAFVMGNNVTNAIEGSVVLGNKSAVADAVGTANTIINGVTYNFAGTNPVSTVSVGSKGEERTITNVAAGRISDTSTDAINGSQLYATNLAITTSIAAGKIHFYSVNNTNSSAGNYNNDGATGPNALAAGVNAKAGETSSIAIGTDSSSTGIFSTAIGNTSNASGGDALAIGRGSDSTGVGSVAIGSATQATHGSAVAVGSYANASEVSSIAVGEHAVASAYTAAAIGAKAKATLSGSSAFGSGSNASGQNATSIGASSTASGSGSLALGLQASATDGQTVAIGRAATASHDSSVALGSYSTTAEAVGTSSAKVGDVEYKGFAGTTPKSTVSVGRINAERTITNVAAGRISKTSTDAINGSQLYAVAKQASSPLTFAGDTGDNVNRKLGETVNVIGGKTEGLTENNIGVVADGKDTLTVKLAKELVNLTSATFTDVAGAQTVVNGVGVTITPSDKTKSVVNLTETGLNNGGNQITNVASGGDVDTNAANIGDVKRAVSGTKTEVVQGENIVVTESKGGNGQSIYKVATVKDLKVDSVTAGDTLLNNNGVKVGDNVALTKDGLTVGDVSIKSDGINAGGNKITGVANGNISADSTDAVNGSQLYQVAQQAGKHSSVAAGQNMVVTTGVNAKGGVEYTVATAKEVTFDKTTVGTVVTDSTTNKITGLANGDVSASSSDAVNGSQISSISTSIANNLGGGAKVNADGTISSPTYNVTNGDPSSGNTVAVYNVGDAISNLSVAVQKPLTFETDSGSYAAKLGATVGVKGDGNNVSTAVDTNGNITVKMSDTPNFTSVTTGGTVVNSNGITTGNGTGPSLTTNGISAGSKKITNVAAGTDDTDAVNVSQLKAATGDINNKINKNDRRASAGTASAMAAAGLPQAYLPGHSMVAVAGGTHRGQNAIALGVSRISDNGKVIVKLTGATNSENDTSASVGVGYQW